MNPATLLHTISLRIRPWHLFTAAFLVRIIWSFFIGLDHTALNKDAGWILRLIHETGAGKVNYDIGRFITSPLYPFAGGLYKILFGPWWLILFILTQVILASLSVVWLYRLAMLQFNAQTATLAAIVFVFFPMTFWWTGTISSESPFQALLIGSIYYLVLYLHDRTDKTLMSSAILFSLAYLTKSHILLFAPFIALFLWQNRISIREGLIAVALYGGVSLIFSLPFGYHCLRTHGTCVLSSNGLLFHFYTGNHNFAYRTIVDVPERGTAEYVAMQEFEFTPFNGPVHDSLMALPQKTKQKAYFKESLRWVKSHPTEFLTLKAYNLFFFLTPGLSWRHYAFLPWLGTFLLTLPVYFFAYRHLWRLVKSGAKDQYWFGYLFLTMVFFSVVFYVQNRFRTITLEPFYIVFAAEGIRQLLMRRWSITRDDTSLPSES
jgi:4-amino-4-deoxy-L-arabinose transferase-like glycosyltransferase